MNKSGYKANVIIYILPQCLTGLIYFPLLPIIPEDNLSIYIPTSFFLSLIILVCVMAHRTAKNLEGNVKRKNAKGDKN